MCGIVGMAGPLVAKDEKPFKVLLMLDWLRGQDSTGVCAVSKKGEPVTLKVADDPIILLTHSDYESTVVGTTDAIWIGHNRASTIGATTRANAHPFTCDHITGVHNGTLTKESLADLENGLTEVYGTDSETIFAHIAKHGVDATIPKLAGAWALVWFDYKAQTLNMIRNAERPLYTCELERAVNKAQRCLMWASEYQMITAARDMAESADTIVMDDDGYAYWPLDTDTLTTWKLSHLVNGITNKQTQRVLEGKPKPPAAAVVPFKPTVTTSSAVVKVDRETRTEVIIKEDEEAAGHYFGGRISHSEWDNLASHGCSFCQSDVSPDDNGLALFMNEKIVLCPECSGENVTTIGGNLQAYMDLVF